MNDVLFRTSLYGRFGHLVMATAGLAFAVLFGLPFLLPGPSRLEILVLAGSAAFSIGGLGIALYSAWFMVAPSGRIRCTNEALFYRGFFGSLHLPWLQLESVKLNFAGRSPFIFLMVRRRGSSSAHKINVSGLTPTHEVLVELVRSRMLHASSSASGHDPVEVVSGESGDSSNRSAQSRQSSAAAGLRR